MSSALPTGLEVMRTTVNANQPRDRCTEEISLTLGLERDIDLLQHLHRVGAAAFLLGIIQDIALLRDGLLDHIEEHGSERALHVRTDPDQEPVVELHARREHGTDTRTRADGDTAAVEVSEVRKSSELCGACEFLTRDCKSSGNCAPSSHECRDTSVGPQQDHASSRLAHQQ